MSIRTKLNAIYTAIFIGALSVLTLAVYFLPRNQLLVEIDNTLEQQASTILAENQVFSRSDLPDLVNHNQTSPFETATTFTAVFLAGGRRLNESPNLATFEGALDEAGLTATEPVFNTVVHDGQSLRVLTTPIYLREGQKRAIVGYLQIAQLLSNYDTFNRLVALCVFIGLAAISFSLLLVTWLTPPLFRPLEDMAAIARQISRADDLSRRVPDTGRNDEIGDLTQALNQTLERLEMLFRTQQRFLADVSHELRTPLTTIRGNLDLMRRMGEFDPESLDDIVAEVQRMTRLVNDLLMLARADVGGLPIEHRPVELDSLLIDVVRQLSLQEQAVKLELREVDQVCILGDPDRLRQLILNLADNGLKYTPAGGKVSFGLSKTEQTAHLFVADSGIGIAEKDLPHLFDRFYRVDKARSRAHGGTGLGLSIARSIVQAHNGNIHVTSELGKGTTFYVSLPLLKES